MTLEAIEHVSAILAAYRQGHMDGVKSGLDAAQIMQGWDELFPADDSVTVKVTGGFPPDPPFPPEPEPERNQQDRGPDPYNDVDFFTRIPDVPEQTRISQLEERVGLIEKHFVGVDFVG